MRKECSRYNRQKFYLFVIISFIAGFLLFSSCSFEYGTKAETPTSVTQESMGGKLVSLSTSTKGASILYSVDGGSQRTYSNPIYINKNTELKAVSTKKGVMPSDELVVLVSLNPATSAPVITPRNILGGKGISLSCSDTEAVLFYTLDGSDPTVNSQRYEQDFTIQSSTDIKVVSAKIGCAPSLCEFLAVPVPTLASPRVTSTRVTPSLKQVTLACDDSQAKIYYTTSGTIPTDESTEYLAPFVVDADNTVVSLIAVRQGYSNSSVVTKTMMVSKLEAPTIVVQDAVGGKQITFDSSESSCAFYYTTDGATPNSGSTLYTGPFLCGHSSTIKVYAKKVGFSDSSVVEQEIILQHLPNPSLELGNVLGGVEVSISAQAGSTSYYTLDSSTPSGGSFLYSVPVFVSSSVTFKAISVKLAMGNSDVASQSVLVDQEPTPVITVSSVVNGKQVKIESDDPESAIYYTLTDGGTPSHDSLPYTGPFAVTSTCTVQALVARAGYADSSLSSSSITVNQVSDPVLSSHDVIGGKELSLSCASSGSTIYYTLDDTQPSINSQKYDTPFMVLQSCVVKALSVLPGFTNSSISRTDLVISEIATPVFTLDSSSPGLSKVSIACSTPGVSLYYTLDGTDPTIASSKYETTVNLSSSSLVKVLAVKSGFSSASASQEVVVPIYQIGSTGPGGGYIFYDKGSFTDEWRYLEAAHQSSELQYPWGSVDVFVSGTSVNRGFGSANTVLILLANGTGFEFAARYCDGLDLGGCTDWFLPSRLELFTMYENLHSKGWGNFSNSWYWSSSQFDKSSAYQVDFGNDGNAVGYSKSDSTNVRAVRRF